MIDHVSRPQMILDAHLAGETLQLAHDLGGRQAHAQDGYRGTADVIPHERVWNVPWWCACDIYGVVIPKYKRCT